MANAVAEPPCAGAAVMTFALGIGATSAVYSVVHGVLLITLVALCEIALGEIA
jgi:hypothetical protein